LDINWQLWTLLPSLFASLVVIFIVRSFVFRENEGKQFLQSLLSSVMFSSLVVTIDRIVWKIGLQNLSDHEQEALNRYGWLSDKLSTVTVELTQQFIALMLMIILGYCINEPAH